MNELEVLWADFEKENYQNVIQKASIILEKGEKVQEKDALKLLALSFFRLAKYPESEKYFSLLAQDSNYPDDWFNLLSAATLNKNFGLSEQAFEKTLDLIQNHGTQESIKLPQLYFYYMQALRDVEEYKKAYIQLENLAEIYKQFHITDDTFLIMRSMPSLHQCLEAAKKILQNTETQKREKFFVDIKSGLDDYGVQTIEEFQF